MALDCCSITVGDHVLFGTNCTMATPMHPFCPQERTLYLEYAKPIVIGNDCWIASDVTICGGVMIGDGCVIGAGGVVTSTPFFNSSDTNLSLFVYESSKSGGLVIFQHIR